MEPASVEEPEPATQELLGAPHADRCTNCDAPLASDQRYCVNCGERRGKPRFAFEALVAPPPSPPPQRRRRFQLSSSTSFIAGIATLLLALGVGVLIGHNGNNAKPVAAAAPVIKIGNLGGGQTNTTPASTGNFKAPTVHLTPTVVKKVNAAAAKVLGSGAKNLATNPVQQVNGACSGGAGCQGGKFTGNFFH